MRRQSDRNIRKVRNTMLKKIRKKLLMKGYTLHEHLQKKGHGDHAVIGIFAVISVAGAAAAIAFLIYSGKFFI